jgi:Protein of unknown function (DUF1570)
MLIRISILIGLVVLCNGSSAALAQELETTSELSAQAETAEDADEVEEIVAIQAGQRQTLQGRILVEATAGDLLLETDDGTLWLLDSDQILSRQQRDEPFIPITQEKLAERLLAELPAGFRVHTTPHYVVCYNTSRAYAQWTSSLLERLYKAFTNYWENQGFELEEPEFPLAVLVFNDRQAYDRASRDDLPAGVGNIVGFYSLRSNRVNMFDLTGAEALRAAGSHRGSMREINQMLSQPAAVPLVATIVHEATHQIAFNCGLATRYADIPLWLCEGMAVYFEAPDLASTRGWRGIGRVNYPRLTTFRENLPGWNSDSLERLVADDRRFRNPRSAADAYADAWALNYFLIKYRPREYTSYLKVLAAKRPLVPDDSQKRLAEFRENFGELDDLERAFLKQISRVR